MPRATVTIDKLDLAPYAGRWVAIVRGRVAGVGLSPEEARRLAKRNRPKEEPTIVFVSSEGRIDLSFSQDSLCGVLSGKRS